MATRKIRELGDEVLTKQCKEVTKMTLRTKVLIQDMLDTMYEALGVGLAAPQVGVLKRIVVIDVGEGPLILINRRSWRLPVSRPGRKDVSVCRANPAR